MWGDGFDANAGSATDRGSVTSDLSREERHPGRDRLLGPGKRRLAVHGRRRRNEIPAPWPGQRRPSIAQQRHPDAVLPASVLVERVSESALLDETRLAVRGLRPGVVLVGIQPDPLQAELAEGEVQTALTASVPRPWPHSCGSPIARPNAHDPFCRSISNTSIRPMATSSSSRQIMNRKMSPPWLLTDSSYRWRRCARLMGGSPTSVETRVSSYQRWTVSASSGSSGRR